MKNILRKIPYLGALCLIVSSCEFDFPLKGNSDPKIFIECFPCNQDTTFIKVQYAKSLTGSDAPGKEISAMSLKADGQEIALQEEDGKLFTLYAFKPGQEVSITASVPGIEDAVGTTHIPSAPAKPAITFEVLPKDDTQEERLKVRIDVGRDVGKEDFLGLQIAKEKVYTSEGKDDILISSYMNLSQELSFDNIQEIDMDGFCEVSFEKGKMEQYGDHPMYLLTYRQFKNGVYTNFLSSVTHDDLWEILPDIDWTQVGEDFDYEAFTEPYLDYHVTKYRLKFFIYNLSDECYYYAKAQYISNFDMLANMGLIPANFTYSNISGGLGNIGGLYCCESDWFEFEVELPAPLPGDTL